MPDVCEGDLQGARLLKEFRGIEQRREQKTYLAERQQHSKRSAVYRKKEGRRTLPSAKGRALRVGEQIKRRSIKESWDSDRWMWD